MKYAESILGDGITNGNQLEKLAKEVFGDKFKGVYGTKDKLPLLGTNECVIINKPDNVHWIGIYNKNGDIYSYDSFNRPDFIGGYRNSDFDGLPDQSVLEKNCGARVIAQMATALSN